MKVALDSMPALRRQVLELLVTQNTALTTSSAAVELDLPTTTARRVLEDLTAHGVAVRESGGQGKADTWSATAWTRLQWRAGR
jgi:predicted ArsR family transcriptional regulator